MTPPGINGTASLDGGAPIPLFCTTGGVMETIPIPAGTLTIAITTAEGCNDPGGTGSCTYDVEGDGL